jgi:hypothetical protein
MLLIRTSLVIILLLAIVPITVYGQEQNLTKVIEQKFGKPTIGNFGLNSIPSTTYETDVNIIFESPHTVILFGDLRVFGGEENDDLWSAVDLLKTQYGFKWTQTIHDGEGSEGNPGRVYLIMEK